MTQASRLSCLAATAALAAGMVMLLAFSAAFAVEPAKHTVEWYRANPQARQKMLATCQNDHSFDDFGDCRNAQSASQAAVADSLPGGGAALDGSGDPEANPSYYGRNVRMITMVLAECSRHLAPSAWCTAAQTASNNLHK